MIYIILNYLRRQKILFYLIHQRNHVVPRTCVTSLKGERGFHMNFCFFFFFTTNRQRYYLNICP
jgi:hypothetical protein